MEIKNKRWAKAIKERAITLLKDGCDNLREVSKMLKEETNLIVLTRSVIGAIDTT